MTNDISPIIEAIIASFEAMGETATAAAEQLSGAMGGAAGAMDEVAVSAAESAGAVDVNTASMDTNTASTDANTASKNTSTAASNKFNIALLAAGAAVVATGVAATKTAGDFQAGIISLVTGAGEAASNIGMISDGVLHLATATGQSTSDLISALYMIESAGHHGADGLAVLESAAEGAKVGNADLMTVADGVTTVMTDYASSNLSAVDATNLLIATVAYGKTHLQDLAASLSTVLPTASTAGVKLTDVAGALATLTGQGIKAAEAATYVKQTIMAIDAPSSKATAVLQEIGLTTEQLSETMKESLPDALDLLTTALAKKFPVGSAQYLAAIKEITGGTRMMQGVLDLTGSHMQTFRDNVANVSGAVTQGKDSVTGWNLVQTEFNYKMDHARAVVEVFMISIGTQLLPVLGHAADFVAGTVVPALSNFAMLLEHNHQALAMIGSLLTGVVLAAIWSLGSMLAGAAIAAIPLILTFSRIVSVVALVAMHWNDFINIMKGATPQMEAARIGILALGGAISGFLLKQLVLAIPSIWASVTAFAAQAGAAIAAAGAMLVAAAPFILIGAAIGAVIGIIILLVTHWKQVTEFLGGVWKGIEGTARTVWGAIASFFTAMWQGITTGVKNAWNAITGAFVGAITWIKNLVFGFVQAIVGFWVWLYNHNYYFHDLVTGIMAIFSILKNFVSLVWAGITAFLTAEWDGIKAIAEAAWKLIQLMIIQPIKDTWAKIQWFAGLVSSAFQTLWHDVTSGASGAWNNFTNIISIAVGSVTHYIGDIINAIKGPLTGLANDALNWGKNLIDAFINGIKAGADQVGKTASDIANNVKKFLGFHSPAEEGPGAEADTWPINLIKMYASGIISSLPILRNAATQASATIQEGIAPSSLPSGSLGPALSTIAPSGTTGGQAGGITIVLDRSISLLDPQYRKQIAQGLAGDLSQALARKRDLQTIPAWSYPGR